MSCSCVCFRSEPAMGRLTISVRNKTVMTRALKTTMWSAEQSTICGEFLLKTCVGFHPICMITVLVCVLKLQHGRSSVPQVTRRDRQLWLERYDYCIGLCSETSTWSLFCSTGYVLDSYDSSAKDDSGLPSCQQFAVSTCWRHALAFIRLVWLLYWFVFWNFNMVALLFHRLEDVLDKTR